MGDVCRSGGRGVIDVHRKGTGGRRLAKGEGLVGGSRRIAEGEDALEEMEAAALMERDIGLIHFCRWT